MIKDLSAMEEFKDCKIEKAFVSKPQEQSYNGLSVLPKGEKDSLNFNLIDSYNLFEENDESESTYIENVKNLQEAIRSGLKKMISVNLLKESMSDYEKIKPFLTIQIVSQKRNEETMKNSPHFLLNDLVAFFRVRKEIDGYTYSSIITNSLLNQYNISEEELLLDACKYLFERDPMEILPLQMFLGIPSPIYSPIYVAKTKSGVCGAAVLVNRDFFNEAYDKLKEDYYIIPSSIHELLLIPESFVDAEYLADIIQSVNREVVDPSEVLSDHAYHFEKSTNTFESAEEYMRRKSE